MKWNLSYMINTHNLQKINTYLHSFIGMQAPGINTNHWHPERQRDKDVWLVVKPKQSKVRGSKTVGKQTSLTSQEKIKPRICFFLLALLIVNWESAVVVARRPFPSTDGMSHPDQHGLMEEAYSYKLSKIWSTPPSCEHKCYGCTPSEAIQVQSTRCRRSHLRL
ncbi:hypothetical protein GmHk_13G036251 [Glycine max]|nr:hypothetical protein GmHk_13G036251 [Glycine max]